MGLKPNPPCTSNSQEYCNICLRKLGVLGLGVGERLLSTKLWPLAGCQLMQHGTASLGQDDLHLLCLKTFPHSYQYWHPDPWKEFGGWRRSLGRAGEGDWPRQNVAKNTSEEWEGELWWAETPSPCTSFTVPLTSLTKPNFRCNINNFKTATAEH